VRDFMIWEPGEKLYCVLCDKESGGADPPGNWFRHRPSHRRRIPILGPGDLFGPGDAVLGYLEYVDP
jgi:hypothetical protein